MHNSEMIKSLDTVRQGHYLNHDEPLWFQFSVELNLCVLLHVVKGD